MCVEQASRLLFQSSHTCGRPLSVVNSWLVQMCMLTCMNAHVASLHRLDVSAEIRGRPSASRLGAADDPGPPLSLASIVVLAIAP